MSRETKIEAAFQAEAAPTVAARVARLRERRPARSRLADGARVKLAQARGEALQTPAVQRPASRWESFEAYAEARRLNERVEIEFSDRYTALGIPRPDIRTGCRGQCEATGYIPIYVREGDKRAGEPGHCSLKTSESDPEFRRRWEAAEAKKASADGWHFITCPTCEGTRLRKPPFGVSEAEAQKLAAQYAEQSKGTLFKEVRVESLPDGTFGLACVFDVSETSTPDQLPAKEIAGQRIKFDYFRRPEVQTQLESACCGHGDDWREAFGHKAHENKRKAIEAAAKTFPITGTKLEVATADESAEHIRKMEATVVGFRDDDERAEVVTQPDTEAAEPPGKYVKKSPEDPQRMVKGFNGVAPISAAHDFKHEPHTGNAGIVKKNEAEGLVSEGAAATELARAFPEVLTYPKGTITSILMVGPSGGASLMADTAAIPLPLAQRIVVWLKSNTSMRRESVNEAELKWFTTNNALKSDIIARTSVKVRVTKMAGHGDKPYAEVYSADFSDARGTHSTWTEEEMNRIHAFIASTYHVKHITHFGSLKLVVMYGRPDDANESLTPAQIAKIKVDGLAAVKAMRAPEGAPFGGFRESMELSEVPIVMLPKGKTVTCSKCNKPAHDYAKHASGPVCTACAWKHLHH